MKSTIILIYTAFLVIFASCEKESNINFGFDSPINKDSKGMLVVDISQSYARIFLSGYISLSEGEVEIILMNPNGVAIFSKTLVAPDELHVNEAFEASRGYWKLQYISRNGKGYIDLHISNF
ncbi:MAG: hypothetical protein R6W81_11305 [Bacteroidales bacterium]